MYAQLCLRLSEEAPNFDDPGKTGNSTFRRLLLKQCEEEFNNRSKASQAFDKKDDPLTQEEEEQRLSTKRKMLGNIRFIGELAKLDMLHETILHKCIKQLLDKKKRASVADTSEDMECLCHLMRTVGGRIDVLKAKPLVDQYFDRIFQILSRPDLQSRIRFMLEDTVQLRINKWIPRKVARDIGPKTIYQIRQEAWQEYPPPHTSGHGPSRNSPPHPPGNWFGRPHQGPKMQSGRPGEHAQGRGFNDVFLMDENGQAPRFDEFGKGGMDQRQPYGISYNEDEFERFTPKDPWAGLAETTARSSPPMGSPPTSRNHHYGGSPPGSRKQQYGSRRPPTRPSQLTMDGEISLRPARDSIAAKTLGMASRPQGKLDPLNRNKAPPIIEKPKPKKPQGPSKADLEKQMAGIVKDYMANKDDTAAIKAIKNMKAEKRCKSQVLQALNTGLEKNEEERHLICQLLQAMHKDGMTNTDTIIQCLQSVLEEKGTDDSKEYIATMAARTIIQGLVTLSDIGKLMDAGSYYPTLLLILKKLEELNGQEWLLDAFNDSKIDLLSTFQESARNSGKMMMILDEKSLSFLFPLLRIQADLYKTIEEDPNSSTVYKWIKENVDASLHSQPEFVVAITTCVLTYATQDSTLDKGIDYTLAPDKDLVEKEKLAVKKLKPVMDKFLHEKINLQVAALYSLQMFCHTNNYPKGFLLRMFMLMYDLEIIEEEAYVKWKEDVNEKYPGKGKALFQVNTWLTWLETADEEGSESEPE